jgi:hypothetical protein
MSSALAGVPNARYWLCHECARLAACYMGELHTCIRCVRCFENAKAALLQQHAAYLDALEERVSCHCAEVKHNEHSHKMRSLANGNLHPEVFSSAFGKPS